MDIPRIFNITESAHRIHNPFTPEKLATLGAALRLEAGTQQNQRGQARILMRMDGTLTKWNDDRGFGFITPTQGGAEIFAHVSAFPRDGQRPRIGERLTFEIGTGKDGKKQARNILCPTRPTEKPYRLSEPARRSEKPYRLSEPVRRRDKPGLLRRLIPLGMVIALGAYGYNAYTQRATPHTAHAVQSSVAATPGPFHCDGRQHCSQMGSRAEAEYFLMNCPDTKMDGDHDGIPCENDSRF